MSDTPTSFIFAMPVAILTYVSLPVSGSEFHIRDYVPPPEPLVITKGSPRLSFAQAQSIEWLEKPIPDPTCAKNVHPRFR